MKRSLLILILCVVGASFHAQGVLLVKDMIPGEVGAFETGGEILGARDGIAYLYLEKGSIVEFWRTDGTTEGTYILDSIPDVMEIRRIKESHHGYVFYINDTTNMNSLWILWTETGTLERLVIGGAKFLDFVVYQDELLYHPDVSTESLISVDLFTKVPTTVHTYGFFGARMLAATDDFAFVIADPKDSEADGTGAFYVYRDGNLTLQQVVNTGSEFSQALNPLTYQNKLYFWYHPANDPYQLWVTDGTLAGTEVIFDDSQYSSYLVDFYFEDGMFVGTDLIIFTGLPPGGCTNCWDVYILNPATNEAGLVDFIKDATETARSFTNYNGDIFFSLQTDYGGMLTRTDGTLGGSEIFSDRDSLGYEPLHLATHKGLIFYSALNEDYENAELRSFNPDQPDRSMIYEIRLGNDPSSPSDLLDLGDRLIFLANDGIHGRELFAFDSKLSAIREEKARPLNVYPSIAKDVVNVDVSSIDGVKQIHLSMLNGMSSQINPTESSHEIIQIPVASLSEGVYYIELITESGERYLGSFVKASGN